MKKLRFFLLTCSVVSLTFAQNAVPTPAAAKAVATVAAREARLTAPIALKDGVISQPELTGLTDGGKAVFAFTVPKAGDYEIYADVNAPDDDSNSFFANMDAEPKDDLMIWDLALTDADKFEECAINWRGDDAAASNGAKAFKLTAGAHQLILIGREPAKLKGISIYPAASRRIPPPAPATPATTTPAPALPASPSPAPASTLPLK